MTPTLAAAPVDLADLIKSASQDQHNSTENRTFMTQLMGGELSLQDYTRYLAQYAWVYEALETLVATIDGYELFDPRLNRFASIENDLAALGAADWRETHAPLPATAAYVAHLNSLSENDGVACLAHHYTRYLGDLSGGQVISRLVARHYDATPEQLSFYTFTEIDQIVPYKRAYREGMNALSLSQDEIDALVQEVDAAFTFNGAIFDELGA